MRVGQVVFVILFLLAPPLNLSSQQATTLQRDVQAIAILTRAVTAAGGISAAGAVQDFTASGSITYFEKQDNVSGTVTIRGKGLSQFRLDAVLPTGQRSLAVNTAGGLIGGSSKEVNGLSAPIPYHNAIAFGSLTFPLGPIVTRLNDLGTNFRYMGLATVDGHQVHQVRIEPFATEGDPGDMLCKLNSKDVFIDGTTLQITAIRDMLHPDGDSTIDFPHEVDFSDYRIVDGLLVPFSITQIIGGNRTWTIELTQIAFNNGLPDAVFQP